MARHGHETLYDQTCRECVYQTAKQVANEQQKTMHMWKNTIDGTYSFNSMPHIIKECEVIKPDA